MNALSDPRVAEFLNENFISTYLKVGTFQIINGQKVGGNVASYFCLHDGGVLHAIPGPVTSDVLLSESRWACETRKLARTSCVDLATGGIDHKRYRDKIAWAHAERFLADENEGAGKKALTPIPLSIPRHTRPQAQAHWLLAKQPLAKLDAIYPVVWTQILREKLSGLPVAQR